MKEKEELRVLAREKTRGQRTDFGTSEGKETTTHLPEDSSIVTENTLDELEAERSREMVEHEELLLSCRRS